MNDNFNSLTPLFSLLDYSLTTVQTTFNKIPGSAVLLRYVKSSHRNDPGRTLLELILLLFAIRTLLQSRTRADRNGSHFIQFSEKVFLFGQSLPLYNKNINIVPLGNRRAGGRMVTRTFDTIFDSCRKQRLGHNPCDYWT